MTTPAAGIAAGLDVWHGAPNSATVGGQAWVWEAMVRHEPPANKNAAQAAAWAAARAVEAWAELDPCGLLLKLIELP